MKLLIMQFSPTSCHFIPHLSSTLFSNNFSLCSSLNARDQVSRPYKITGKIMMFLYSNLYDIRQEMETQKLLD
jgi:hypothetical protein